MGRGGSSGFPGKNIYPVLGRPLMEYPLIAATRSKSIDRIFVSTDSSEIKQIGRKYGAAIIDRPPELCSSQALGEDVYVHAYDHAKKSLGEPIDLVVLLMCNAATITGDLIDEGIQNPSMPSGKLILRSVYLHIICGAPSGHEKWGMIIFCTRLSHLPHSEILSTLNCDRDSQEMYGLQIWGSQ